MDTPISKRLLGANELLRLEKIQNKYGDWIIILSRAVPVLAETSILTAGIGRMPFRRFILLVLLSNLGISIVYSLLELIRSILIHSYWRSSGAIILPGAAGYF